VLIIALVLLLVLTVLGVTGMRSAFLEERMTGNTQDLNIAFEASEAALRNGEATLRQPDLADFDDTAGLYQPAAPTSAPLWETVDWNDGHAVREYTGLDSAPGNLARADARYFIEELPRITSPGESLAADTAVDEAGFYRVTARATGAGSVATVMLQTTYRR
jgi:type IV pilus assembly protein PilX